MQQGFPANRSCAPGSKARLSPLRYNAIRLRACAGRSGSGPRKVRPPSRCVRQSGSPAKGTMILHCRTDEHLFVLRILHYTYIFYIVIEAIFLPVYAYSANVLSLFWPWYSTTISLDLSSLSDIHVRFQVVLSVLLGCFCNHTIGVPLKPSTAPEYSSRSAGVQTLTAGDQS